MTTLLRLVNRHVLGASIVAVRDFGNMAHETQLFVLLCGCLRQPFSTNLPADFPSAFQPDFNVHLAVCKSTGANASACVRVPIGWRMLRGVAASQSSHLCAQVPPSDNVKYCQREDVLIDTYMCICSYLNVHL